MGEYPRRLYHNTPGWVGEGALFHLRFRVAASQASLTEPGLAAELLRAARRYHETGNWWCELFLLMPDHAHAMLAFPATSNLTVTVRNWKRGTSRFQQVRWQEGFFDHRLRTERAAREKWVYIRRNPAVKNLCSADDDWPWWWSPLVSNDARSA